jgi:membrane protein YqaA with SNARE-associated domain
MWLLALALRSPTRAVSHWLYRLGGIGLIPLGILDSSLVPIPGSLDAMTIVLSTREHELWPYYALMATVGSVLGAFLTYRLAHKRGRKMLEKKLSKPHMKRVNAIVKRWGFGAILVPALLPPPAPMVPFVIAAGAMQYSRNRFLVAFTIGRAVRYTLLAFLGARYGRQILHWIVSHERSTLYVLIGILVLGLASALIYWWTKRKPARKPSKLARAH